MEFEELIELFDVTNSEEEEFLIDADLLRDLLYCYFQHHFAMFISKMGMKGNIN